MMHRLAACSLAAMLCNCGGAPPFEGLSPLPPEETGNALMGEFAVNVEITDAIGRLALRRPEPRALVEAQLEAMLAYTRQRGRGDMAWLGRAPAPPHPLQPWDQYLAHTALQLSSFLDLDSGPRELSRVALTAVQARLGADAVYQESAPEPEGSIAVSDLLPELRAGIAILSLGHIDAGLVDRILAVLSQWAEPGPAPRAVVLDLSRADFEDVDAASRLFGTFAPGQAVLELVYRNSESGKVERRAFAGATGWGLQHYTKVPVFVVLSAETGIIAEAFAHALRHHRAARVLGNSTTGAGRGMVFHDLPWGARFGFTVYDVIGTDGKPMAGRPIIPDVCWGEHGFVPVARSSAAAVPDACQAPHGGFDKAGALEYIRQQLSMPSETQNDIAPPLKDGEEHG